MKNSASFRRRSKRSRGLRRRLVAATALGAIVAIAFWGFGRHGGRTIARPVVAAAPAPKKPPTPIAWSTRDAARLRARVRGAFAPALAGAETWSLAVLDGSGRPLFDAGAQRAVAPASVTKLVVAATALDVLGPAFRYHTILAAPHSISADGKLDGDLWLAGSGDPSLRGDDLKRGVGTLARAGLRSIAGGVAVDPTAMRGPELNPHWSADDAGQDYAAPTNALSVDGDTIESSKLVAGVEERFWTPVQNVPQYVAAMLASIARARGILTTTPPRIGSAPLNSVVLWDHPSAPLRALETHMLVFSDNHYAEQLLRTVGGEAAGSPDDRGGLTAERTFLSERGIPVPGLRLLDGSGLSPGDRVAAITFARLLADAELRGARATLYPMLPLGGRQGTLEDYPFTSALGRVRAKSGHLSDVSALAGYVNTRRHGRIVFAFLIDGSPGDPDSAIVHAVDRISEF